MDDPSIIQIVIFIILLILSAFFFGGNGIHESVSRVRLTTLKEDGSKKSERALKIIDHPGKMLSTILIGNNIVNISATSLATAFTIRVFGNVFRSA